MSDPTADDLERIIAAALEARQLEDAVLALELLVRLDPRRGLALYEDIQAVIRLRRLGLDVTNAMMNPHGSMHSADTVTRHEGRP